MPIRPVGLNKPAQLIRLRGAPYERGREHGQRARQAILANLELVGNGMHGLAQRGFGRDFEAILSRNESFAQRQAPELIEEIVGIAEGADVAYRDLLLLNLPLYTVGVHLPLDCSQLLVTAPASEDGNTYLAKTRDFASGNFQHVMTHREFADGVEMIEVNAAGSITWPGSGSNSHGLTLSTSGVWSKRTPIDEEQFDATWLLINVHLLLRDSRSVDELEENLRAQPRLTGLNIVAADPEQGAAFEVSRDRVVRFAPEDGVLVRTNHYLAPELRDLAPTVDEYPQTYRRYELARQRLNSAAGSWNLDRMVDLVRYHADDPTASICRHLDFGARADTVYASVAAVPDGRFWSTLDRPCGAGGLFSNSDSEDQ